MMLSMYSAISKCQMCFSLCSNGAVALGKGKSYRLKWKKPTNEKHLFMFPAKSALQIIFSLAHAVRIHGQRAGKPIQFYLAMSSCCQELMESTSIQSSWVLDALRIWKSGENQWQCLLLLAGLSMIILGKPQQTRRDVCLVPPVYDTASFLAEILFKRFIIKLFLLPFFPNKLYFWKCSKAQFGAYLTRIFLSFLQCIAAICKLFTSRHPA